MSATRRCSPTSPRAYWSAATSGSWSNVSRPRTEPAAVRLEQAVASLVAIANERETLEREALEAETLRRTDAVKTAVIQSVSHDLRTPLATIETALDGLRARRSQLDGAQRARAPGIRSATSFGGSSATSRTCSICRAFRRSGRPSQAIWTADALAEQALDELSEGDRVRVEVPADLPPIRTDAAQMQRALVNVLENALKFSPPQTTVILRRASGEATRSSFASTTKGRESTRGSGRDLRAFSARSRQRRCRARACDRARIHRRQRRPDLG